MIKTKKLRVNVDISIASVFWILFAIGMVIFVSNIIDILILLFTAILISFSINPLVNKMEKLRIPRAVSSLLVIIIVFGGFGLAAASIISPLIAQTQSFLETLPRLIASLTPVSINWSDYTPQFMSVPNRVYSIAAGTLTSIVGALTLIVISYYLIQERPHLLKYLKYWFGEKAERYNQLANDLEEQIGHWFRGELLLMLIIGVFAYIGFMIIGLPYAVPLAVIAGLMEIVPNIGPVVSTIPAIIVGLSISPSHGIAALIVAITIHQLENNFITPTVMRHAADLNPVITIVSIMIGYQLGGPLMSVLALPTVLCGRVILNYVHLNKKTNIPEIN